MSLNVSSHPRDDVRRSPPIPGAPASAAGTPSRVRPQLARHIPVVIYADEWGGVGGTAGYVIMLARGLRRRGYRVATLCHGGERTASMRAALDECGAEVITLDDSDDRTLRGRLRRQRSLQAVMRRYSGCVLALMMGYFTRGGGVTLAAALAGAAAIVRADLTPPEPPITRKEKTLLRLKDRLTDRVVVGAWENVEAFSRETGRGPLRMRVIHTGIELQRFHPGEGRAELRAEFGYTDSDIVIGTVSRLDDDRKGVAYFLEMAALVASSWPHARFLIVGEGVLREGLEARAAELGIRDRVAFAGWRTDVPRVLAGMDAFVMPSLFEGGPTSVLEAMAMALPVVATRVGMVLEVIDDGRTGLIVATADAGALAGAVSTLLADETACGRMGRAARAHAEAHFSIDQMVERYLQVFAEAVVARSPGRRRRGP